MRKSDDCASLAESACPAHAAAPYFDDAARGWIFSRYVDVLSAFRSSDLVPAGPRSEAGAAIPDQNRMQSMPAATQETLSPEQLRAWREPLESEAQVRAANLPVGRPIELMGGYAQPLCLTLAAMVTNIDLRDAERLRSLAEPVSASVAEPYDTSLKKRADAANASLRACFHSGPEPLRDSGFVALAHTVPCLLANAWFTLLHDQRQWNVLHQDPSLLGQAVEELLRFAELPRILFRQAAADLEIGGVSVRKGDRIVLRIIDANRDPEQFLCAERVDVLRRGNRHLTLGAGPHSCVGASLIRLALGAITRPLVEGFAHAALDRPVEWKGGSGFRFPASLWVLLSPPGSDAERRTSSHCEEPHPIFE